MKKFYLAIVIILVIASVSYADSDSATRDLFRAVQKSDVTSRQISQLIKRGADIYAYDKEGFTPLIYAVRNNNYDAVNTLIKAGADVNARDKGSYAAALMFTANTLFDPEIADIRIIKALINAGADVNSQDSAGNNILMLMCSNGTAGPEVIKLLLESGADVNAANEAGQTALISIAANIWSEHGPEIAEILINAGADVNVHDTDGNDIFYYAEDNDEVKRVLLREINSRKTR